jgi:hypothetical protein
LTRSNFYDKEEICIYYLCTIDGALIDIFSSIAKAVSTTSIFTIFAYTLAVYTTSLTILSITFTNTISTHCNSTLVIDLVTVLRRARFGACLTIQDRITGLHTIAE